MAFRITLECGDSSSLRTKKTHEGYTHDWEVFVRGIDNAAVHHYIEKVVFNLHETFPKPKRVIKEPPFSVKESGYAGFDIPIHIYLKNKNEPKRFEIMYNLNLETSVPAVSHVIHHNEIIVNPTDEFRKKLLKGGAIPISSAEGTSEKNEAKTLSMVGKPKLSGNEGKKQRISEPKISNPFNDLFGIPIKTAKISLENKKISEKLVNTKNIPISEKSDRIDKNAKVKHSPYKDCKKEKSSEERKEKKEKEIIREKEKVKEKSKRSSSPSNKINHQSSESKKSLSPSPMKKPLTPPMISKRLSSPSSKIKEKDLKKMVEPEKEKEKIKENVKNFSDETKTEKSEKDNKSDRKKDKKKYKEDRDKEKKEKYKDKERDKKDKNSVKNPEKKVERYEKLDKDKLYEPKNSKEERKSPKSIKENEKIKVEKSFKLDKSEKSEKLGKQKELKIEKSDKVKHKHKKRDKKDKRDGSKEREKKEKRDKLKVTNEKQNEITNQTSSTLIALRVADVQERDSSESAASADEDSIIESRTITNVKKESVALSKSIEIIRTMSPPPPRISEIKKDKNEKKRDRSKSSREDKEVKKKKKRNETKVFGDEEFVKKSKDPDHSTSPLVEPVSSSQSPIATNVDLVHVPKVKHADDRIKIEPVAGESEQVAPDSTNSTLVDTEETLVFSEDYVSQLKDLQQKIMTLQDNQELQRVVQVIAETGQYEITKKTFDFDLCALDKRTVQRLQQFFAS